MAMFKFMGIVASIMIISPTLSAAETLVPSQSGYRVLEGPVWFSPEDVTFSAVKLGADGRHSKDIGVYLLDLAGLAQRIASSARPVLFVSHGEKQLLIYFYRPSDSIEIAQFCAYDPNTGHVSSPDQKEASAQMRACTDQRDNRQAEGCTEADIRLLDGRTIILCTSAECGTSTVAF